MLRVKRFYTLRLEESVWKKLRHIIESDVGRGKRFPTVSELVDYMCDLYLQRRLEGRL